MRDAGSDAKKSAEAQRRRATAVSAPPSPSSLEMRTPEPNGMRMKDEVLSLFFLGRPCQAGCGGDRHLQQQRRWESRRPRKRDRGLERLLRAARRVGSTAGGTRRKRKQRGVFPVGEDHAYPPRCLPRPHYSRGQLPQAQGRGEQERTVAVWPSGFTKILGYMFRL